MGSEYIFQRNSRAELPSAFSGSGCYIHDNKGNTYLDGSGELPYPVWVILTHM